MAEQSRGGRIFEERTNDGAPSFYANHVNVVVTPWDMRLRFSQIDDVTEKGMKLRDVAFVYLAPGQARALLKILKDNEPNAEAMWGQQGAIIASLGKDNLAKEEK